MKYQEIKYVERHLLGSELKSEAKKSGSRIPALNHCVISITFFFDKEIWEKFNILVRKRWLSVKWYDVVLIYFCYSPDPSKIKYEDNDIIKGQDFK